jgi:hypothetical protein
VIAAFLSFQKQLSAKVFYKGLDGFWAGEEMMICVSRPDSSEFAAPFFPKELEFGSV